MTGDGFGDIPKKPGVYCLRTQRIGDYDQAATVARYLGSPMFAALQAMSNASEMLFNDCGFGQGWGWKWYADEAKQRLESMKAIAVDGDGSLLCPILYIGCSTSLWHRMKQLMEIGHVANHPLWALLYSRWPIELGIRITEDCKAVERQLKQAYRDAHNGQLAPIMKR